MSPTVLITGMLLGVLQLAVGIAVGYWIAGSKKSASTTEDDRRRAQRLAGELRTLTADLSAEARRQGEQLERVDDRLQSESRALSISPEDNPLTALVSGVIREMLQANQQLQQRLMTAELEVESQAAEIAEHLHTAMTDPLTELPNRRAMDDHLSMRADAWRKHKTPYSVVMLDVDHFKQFNDTHGHAAGDEALKTIASALREALRQHDVVARYGGEEFALILPHTSLQTGQSAVHKAIQSVRATTVKVGGQSIPVTASAGLASIAAGERIESLMSRADQALYAAKQAGRNQAWLHDGAVTAPLSPPDSEPQAAVTPPELNADLKDACSALTDRLGSLLNPDSVGVGP
ncbi:putative diguanylate cyclase YdaM [Posidoniimonas polymericola]|uniref:diguanylate cyclase n=1 Tax=Posidoniimonas polymericola TaxID=2528002 RepID=A0A5C5YRK1_9BACT|nr:diguanylate cyclase [Posidoniimonas polymericola]TWT77571.1 putative diguanylate cyclase YdaM [Posidoniimonas polymericola]